MKALNDFSRKALRQIGLAYAVTPQSVLAAEAFDVSEVIDVGVADGTPWLYRSFPNARFVLVDPTKGASENVKAPPRDHVFLEVALGSGPGTATLNVIGPTGVRSTLLQPEYISGSKISGEYTVEVTTLDAVIEAHCRSDRIGVKIDAEGLEGDIVRGFETHCPRVRFVIVEASIKRRFQGGALFAELCALLHDRGFAFYNLLNPARVVPPLHYDCLFVRADDERLSAKPIAGQPG